MSKEKLLSSNQTSLSTIQPELWPLVRATIDNVEAVGAADALTGPVARGDADTVARHLDALPVDERAPYRALAREALRLSGRDDPSVRDVLGEELA